MADPVAGAVVGLPPEPAWGEAPNPLYFRKQGRSGGASLQAGTGAAAPPDRVDPTRSAITLKPDMSLLGNTNVPDFVTRATPAVLGEIGGFCPWLRQGWDFVDTLTDSEKSLVSTLPGIRKHLLPETFTSFSEEGGRMLTELWRMKRWQ